MVFVKKPVEVSTPQIVVANPELAFARLVKEFHPEPRLEPGVHPSSVVGDNVSLGKRVTLSAGVNIGNNVVIGNDVVLYLSLIHI